MQFSLVRSLQVIALAIFIVLRNCPLAAAEAHATFVLTVSLASPYIHVGEELVLKETMSNPADHIVVANTGVTVELLEEKGNDIGIHAMGGKREDPGLYFGPT